VLLFIAGDFRRGRRRPARPSDDIPVQPLLDLLSFWVLLAAGCFCIALSGFSVMVPLTLHVRLNREMTAGLALLPLAGIACIERSLRFWRRLRN
jgi:hypothetical protein